MKENLIPRLAQPKKTEHKNLRQTQSPQDIILCTCLHTGQALFSHFPRLLHLGLSGGNKNIFPPRQNPYGHAGSRRENDIKSVRVQ
jgi:hypothetical protein